MSLQPRGFFKRHWYPLTASALILVGVALRLTLVLLGWPHINSEEGAMGVEAIHILDGAHPIYYYGQRYMGVGEAYLGALAFRIFGISVVSLRLSMCMLYTIFMVSMFWLTNMLYTRRVALATLIALALGAPFTTQIELLADGGKEETLAFGALMFALASWLALTGASDSASDSASGVSRGWRARRYARYAAFFGWGLAAGLGLYTYAIIVPFVITSGLLIVVACWRELRGWLATLPIIGLLVGLAPVIIYTVISPLADNPIAVFLALHQSLNTNDVTGWALLMKELDGSLLYTIPQVTGLISPYALQALPLYGPFSLATVGAALLGGVWSLGYLTLLGMATYRPLRTLVQYWMSRKKAELCDAGVARMRAVARVLLALAAWLTLASYIFSATAANNPYSGRYLIGLLIITPAILWPLLDTLSWKQETAKNGKTSLGWSADAIWRVGVIALLAVNLVVGAISVAQAIPDAIAANGRDAKLERDLLRHGYRRFYSTYWTCDLLNFETREQLICAVINDNGQLGLTRYAPYIVEVQADPSAPYIVGHDTAFEQVFLKSGAQNHRHFAVTSLDGWDIFTPIK